MKLKLSKRTKRLMMLLLLIPLLLAVAIAIFLHTPSFGRLPRGARLERIQKSPNYVDGVFRYPVKTEVMTGSKSGLRTMWEFITEKRKDTKPSQPVPSEKADLTALAGVDDCIVWFGHSSYLLQVEGRRFLVDPVFYKAAPVAWANRPYPGTDLWKPADMPPCDWLVITHDHWDHLDCQAVKELQATVKGVLLPLGVGEHFERWGYPDGMLTELDWNEPADLGGGFTVHCLPARHFSGRGMTRNKTLWASFLLKTPSGHRIYIGGDSGYGPHFREIGQKFPGIDLAILENGQYNADWAQIHTLPAELPQVCRDLGAKEVVTVHHSKYTLSKHAWDEPRRNEDTLEKQGIKVLRLFMGRVENLWK